MLRVARSTIRSIKFTRAISCSRPLLKDALRPLDTYERRHNGSTGSKIDEMLAKTQHESMADFVRSVVPPDVLVERPLSINPEQGLTESELLARAGELAKKNKLFRSFIGRGYYGTNMPAVIQRNILENPQWYTSYTPYQAEISQGRLESLINFQTVVRDLTGMDIANASLLDEATAAAEAMIMSCAGKKNKVYYVHEQVWPQTLSVLHTRAAGLGIEIKLGLPKDLNFSDSAGCLVQYPFANGEVPSPEYMQSIADAVHAAKGTFSVAADILALVLYKEPGSFGADIVLGNTQRLGVPLGFGGPHAAYFAVHDQVKRKIPGRIIGRTIDRLGNHAYRLALQTREQHIRREKATSNICTAQALLANIAAMYAVYHGPEGLKDIAKRVYSLTSHLASVIKANPEYELLNDTWFDTLTVMVDDADAFVDSAREYEINVFRVDEHHVAVSLDETVTPEDFATLVGLFGATAPKGVPKVETLDQVVYPRETEFLQQPVFNKYHSETDMLRYMTKLQNKDLSLADAMIPLGSCTMKLNATAEMMPITFPEFANIHPFAPFSQAAGYLELISELEQDLSDITGFAATTVQPNSGAQGEFTGLRVIQAYHQARGQGERNICIIPVSAHGTNPASAAMCGMKVVSVKCTPTGTLDLLDLEKQISKYGDKLAAVMITYPSTYGSFEPTVRNAISMVHEAGGQVYMDGANMNAQIGLTSPGDLGADVCHLNLHKTFCIPHGGGGPGVGPICVAEHLVPFLPAHDVVKMPEAHTTSIPAVSAAPWGSAGILSIPWAYIKMMGNNGLKKATELALLNANYMMKRLEPHYKVAFLNENGYCAHEFIIDIRPFKSIGVEAIDIAKRLQDYSFHGPTMSWPVPNTLMIEPTESESKEELDRMCDALISIREEIREIEEGKVKYEDSVLAYSPHPIHDLLSEKWDRSYSREKAAYPVASLHDRKFWPTVARVDDTYGDMNLFCSCDPVETEQD